MLLAKNTIVASTDATSTVALVLTATNYVALVLTATSTGATSTVGLVLAPIQLQEYQTDMGRCRFDTLGKSNPAHRAGAPTARGRWEPLSGG